METVASWHGEVNYKRYQSLGVVGRLVELGSHDSQLPPRADPRARATVLFLLLSPSLLSLPLPFFHTSLSLSLSSSFPSNFLSRSLLPYLPYIRFTRTHAHVPGHGRRGRARARSAYTLTRALSRQYRKLKDWAMIARGPTWPFHPLPTTLPAIYRAPARLPPREGKEGREWAFVLLSENYRIGREK